MDCCIRLRLCREEWGGGGGEIVVLQMGLVMGWAVAAAASGGGWRLAAGGWRRRLSPPPSPLNIRHPLCCILPAFHSFLLLASKGSLNAFFFSLPLSRSMGVWMTGRKKKCLADFPGLAGVAVMEWRGGSPRLVLAHPASSSCLQVLRIFIFFLRFQKYFFSSCE